MNSISIRSQKKYRMMNGHIAFIIYTSDNTIVLRIVNPDTGSLVCVKEFLKELDVEKHLSLLETSFCKKQLRNPHPFVDVYYNLRALEPCIRTHFDHTNKSEYTLMDFLSITNREKLSRMMNATEPFSFTMLSGDVKISKQEIFDGSVSKIHWAYVCTNAYGQIAATNEFESFEEMFEDLVQKECAMYTQMSQFMPVDLRHRSYSEIINMILDKAVL